MFKDQFDIFLADTPEGRDIHYSIRYQVYCEEMGFESKGQFPAEIEFDKDDERSVHFIVKNKKTGQWVGAVRLIHKNDGLLPIEQLCNLDEEIDQNGNSRVVEMSRLCIIKDVRKGLKDIDPPHGISDEDLSPNEEKNAKLLNTNQLNRMIIWGLFYATAVYCKKHSIKYGYFMTTKILGKVLKRGGVDLINIGKAVQHKGERFPFKVETNEVYHSEIWQNNYTKKIRLFSELSKARKVELELAA